MNVQCLNNVNLQKGDGMGLYKDLVLILDEKAKVIYTLNRNNIKREISLDFTVVPETFVILGTFIYIADEARRVHKMNLENTDSTHVKKFNEPIGGIGLGDNNRLYISLKNEIAVLNGKDMDTIKYVKKVPFTPKSWTRHENNMYVARDETCEIYTMLDSRSEKPEKLAYKGNSNEEVEDMVVVGNQMYATVNIINSNGNVEKSCIFLFDINSDATLKKRKTIPLDVVNVQGITFRNDSVYFCTKRNAYKILVN